jgi:hypothetical protein
VRDATASRHRTRLDNETSHVGHSHRVRWFRRLGVRLSLRRPVHAGFGAGEVALGQPLTLVFRSFAPQYLATNIVVSTTDVELFY